jgi:hypothetical protein
MTDPPVLLIYTTPITGIPNWLSQNQSRKQYVIEVL